MAQAIVMPKLGQTVEEATIVKWHKREGDAVRKGEVLFEIETDKAVLEAESFFDGILLKILVAEGETVPVMSVVGYVGTPGEPIPETPPRPAAARETALATKALETGPTAQSAERRVADVAAGTLRGPVPEMPAPPSVAPPAQPQRLLISPRARALVREKVIDPSKIVGSGPNGRILERDVVAYLKRRDYDQLRITPAAKVLAARHNLDLLEIRGTGTGGRITVGDVERALAERPRPLSKMRQVIARRLTQSFTTTPHFYVTRSVDMTDLLLFRKRLKDAGEVYGVTDFILQAVILALQEVPELNSSTDGTFVRWHSSVDLGIAVGLDSGLVVPVLRAAQELSFRELHAAAEALVAKAKAGKLMPDEMTGSSFTVSNMGMLDVDNFAAIINPGESGILAVASTVERPVARSGEIVVRAVMNITLSADHRIVDGMKGAAFVNAVKRKLEDMELWKSLIW